MIIYEKTNKYMSDVDDITRTIFSKFYATKDEALKISQEDAKVYKIELKSLSREDIAGILSMDHVEINATGTGRWHEVHNIKNITKKIGEIK